MEINESQGGRFDRLLRHPSARLSAYPNILARTIPPEPLIQLIPSAESMSEALRQTVLSKAVFGLEMHTTQRCEELVNSSATSRTLVAIVVPTYNCERYILETLESIAEQSYLETLVVSRR